MTDRENLLSNQHSDLTYEINVYGSNENEEQLKQLYNFYSFREWLEILDMDLIIRNIFLTAIERYVTEAE